MLNFTKSSFAEGPSLEKGLSGAELRYFSSKQIYITVVPKSRRRLKMRRNKEKQCKQ